MHSIGERDTQAIPLLESLAWRYGVCNKLSRESRVTSKSTGMVEYPSPALLRRAPSPLGEGCGLVFLRREVRPRCYNFAHERESKCKPAEAFIAKSSKRTDSHY